MIGELESTGYDIDGYWSPCTDRVPNLTDNWICLDLQSHFSLNTSSMELIPCEVEYRLLHSLLATSGTSSAYFKDESAWLAVVEIIDSRKSGFSCLVNTNSVPGWRHGWDTDSAVWQYDLYLFSALGVIPKGQKLRHTTGHCLHPLIRRLDSR